VLHGIGKTAKGKEERKKKGFGAQGHIRALFAELHRRKRFLFSRTNPRGQVACRFAIYLFSPFVGCNRPQNNDMAPRKPLTSRPMDLIYFIFFVVRRPSIHPSIQRPSNAPIIIS
jgi:hypothetical protein